MVDYSPEEKAIIRTLYRAARPISTNQVAKKSEMSWNTADKYLKRLQTAGKVEMAKKGEKGTKKVWYLV